MVDNKIINRIFSSKVWYYLQNVVVMGLFMYCIKGLTDYDNMEYQTWKNQAGAKAVFAFMAIVFIVRKVRLLNWQSLVATLLFVPFVIERMTFWKESPDILNILKPQMAAEWLALMIIIDMILYKDINNLFKGVNYLLIIYAFLTFGMLYRRNGRMDPVLLVFPFFLFALVKMDEEKTEWLLRRFMDGWFAVFVYVTVRSFVEYPNITARYYGYFLNLGPFGVFMTCSLAVAISALVYSKVRYGRKSFFYIMSIIWIAASIFMLYLIDSRDSIVGAVFIAIGLFLWARKDTSKKAIRKRVLILASFLIAAIAVITTMVVLAIKDRDLVVSVRDSAILMKIPPLRHFMSKICAAAGYSQKGNTFGEKLMWAVDSLSSARISLFNAFRPFFNYEGNGPVGVEVKTGIWEGKEAYWAYNSHNNYVQIIVEYGYFTFIETVVLAVASLVKSVKNYLGSDKKAMNLMPVIWLIMMLGVWIGEVNSLYYPVTFFGFMFIARLLTPDTIKEQV